MRPARRLARSAMKRSASSAERVLTRQVTTSFGVGIEGYPEGYPGPSVTDPVLAPALLWDVLRLRSDERPNLVALDALAGQVPERSALVHVTCRANVGQKVHDGFLVTSGHPASSADRVALDKRPDDRRPLGGAQPVHAAYGMLERSGSQ